ncbi:hypothetical protein R3P38DRAFT_543096 [Favolaschia claudopus]|uniref:Cyclin N-terminal domain-containing protein n=1 Tax=Favolaschia claudopus TaxID=2862362 RepID=A0AAW0CHH9_9AGAR
MAVSGSARPQLPKLSHAGHTKSLQSAAQLGVIAKRNYKSQQRYTDNSELVNWRPSPVHPASLVDPAVHPPALLQLVDIKLDRYVIDYVVERVSEAVEYSLSRSSSHRPQAPSPYTAKFTSFASTVLSRGGVPVPTLLVALVYIARARSHLTIVVEKWARECVFLGAIIVASKYTQDSTLKNVHWALCSGVFGKKDVGRIEREFLEVLAWELSVRQADLMAHHQGLIGAAAKAYLASRVTVPVPVPQDAPPRYQTYLSPPAYTRTRQQHLTLPELDPSSSPQSSIESLSPGPRTPSPYPHARSRTPAYAYQEPQHPPGILHRAAADFHPGVKQPQLTVNGKELEWPHADNANANIVYARVPR